MSRLLYIFLLLLPASAMAQGFEELWATGSAVPEGTCPLIKRPDGQFRFAGPLNAGELKIMTTEVYQEGVTQFLKPQLADSYLINYGLNYVVTSDVEQPGWVVSFQEDTYRFLVDPVARRVTGELMLPWNEVFIAGSAFEGGADNREWNRNGMLPFERDHDNPYVFSWTGQLAPYDNVVEPGRFKLEGQMTWGPRELHPYVQDENLLESTQMRMGGDDTKWQVVTPGVLLSDHLLPQEDGVGEMKAEPGNTAHEVYSIDGIRLPQMQKGLNILRTSDGRVRKVFVR